MMPSHDGLLRGHPSDVEVASAFPVRVARIARGDVTLAEQDRIREQASRIDSGWRGGPFNGLEYFHFRRPEHGAVMAAFLLRDRLHRPVPGCARAPTAAEVEAAWRRMAHERQDILAWARSHKVLMDIAQVYRFERRQGACSREAHGVATKLVEQTDRSVGDPMAYAGVCIEWVEREYRSWFWRCAPNHQVL